ncbi:uncharacterized protein [Montipora capricornis]|uniref:uncharacterized protein n=1 Tax=Montipora capricornis TaxID=246305 RepID=UPI0035F218A0
MAYKEILITTFFMLAWSSKNSGSKLAKVFVSLHGNDCKTCGSQSLPCKTIALAVHHVDYGGYIYLDGRGTKECPYGCKADRNIPIDHRGIYINKSLTIEGLYSTTHVLCPEGFHFQKTNDEQETFRLELSGIDFQQTPISCDDCQHVLIHNCSFDDALSALAIAIQNITSFQLDIQSNSVFYNNSQCINVLLINKTERKSVSVSLNIKNAMLENNGLYGQRRSDVGIMKITSVQDDELCPIYLYISCTKVISSGSKGPFISVNVSTAVTEETYKDVRLYHNGKFHGKSKQSLQSLYFSRSRETKAKFISITCHDNPDVQCIVVQSDRAAIIIKGSLFYNQSVSKNNSGSCLSITAKINGSLRIVNSYFHNNKAGAGGSLYANSKHGFLTIDLANVTFSQCTARTGCAISIGRRPSPFTSTESPAHRLHFGVRNVTIKQWRGYRYKKKCIDVDVLLDGGIVTLEESRFTKKIRRRSAGAFRVVTAGGQSNVTISKCIFKEDALNPTKGRIVQIVAGNGKAGMVTVSDSFLESKVNKRAGLFVSPKYRINLFNVTFISFRYGLQIVSSPPKNDSFPINIYIDNCSFVNNIYDTMLTLLDPTSVHVGIRNTRFTTSNETVTWDEVSNSYAIRLMIPQLKHVNFSKAVIEIDNNEFHHRPPSYFALLFEGLKHVIIRRSLFRNCVVAYRRTWRNNKTGYFYETAAGAISVLLNPDKARNFGCVNTRGTHPSWHYNSHILFEDTTFVENLGIQVGAVYISNGNTTFRRCNFRDNFGIHRTGHVYSAFGTGRVDFVDCSFLRTKENMTVSTGPLYNAGSFLYSGSGGPLRLENTSMISLKFSRSTVPVVDISNGGFFDMDERSKIKCSEGQRLLLENSTHFVYTEQNKSICILNTTVLKYSCKPCSPGYYSLQTGVSEGLAVTSTPECYTCPFGATCIESNIAAKPNFWGYSTSSRPQELQFIACPEHYCPSTVSTGYNSCQGNRNGTLCGQCAKGFTETLFSSNCRKLTKCNDYSVWVVTIFLTIILALYLLQKPPILHILTNQMLWFRKRGESPSGEEVDGIVDAEHSDTGYLKITFYFYQAAETVMVVPIEELTGEIPFIHFVISAYNFHVQSTNQDVGCPFAGLTATTKQTLLSSTVFFIMTDVLVIYIVHSVFNVLMGKGKPSLICYMAVVMEVLLLGYERLTETSFRLVHCVSIGSGRRLFIDANIPCMQWWQYLLLAYIAFFLVPLIVVLYCGSSKLYRSSITAGEFLAACIITLPFLMYWLVKEILHRRRQDYAEQHVVNKELLDIVHGPFRPPNDNDNGTLYWESVLIGRRFILLACEAFITNLMLRMVFQAAACLLITIHHVWKSPYRYPMANKAETLSLIAISLIAIINLAKAALLSFGITIDGPSKSSLKALEWFEVCALAFVPALVSMFVTFAVLSQLARCALFLIEHFKSFCRKFCCYPWYTDQEQRPLLLVAEEIIHRR